MDEITVKQRILQYIEQKKISVREFERRANLSSGYLKSLRKSPTIDKMKSIIRAFPDLNQEWLEYGRGSMINSVGDTIRNIVAQSPLRGDYPDIARDPLPENYMYTETRPRVPLRAANGNLRKWYAGENRHLCEQKPLIQQFPPYQFTLLVSSNSMKPYIDTGDIIACAEISKIVSYGDVYILDTDGEVLIRRVFEADGQPDHYRLVPDNKEYPEIILDRSAVRGIYRVVGLLRVEI